MNSDHSSKFSDEDHGVSMIDQAAFRRLYQAHLEKAISEGGKKPVRKKSKARFTDDGFLELGREKLEVAQESPLGENEFWIVRERKNGGWEMPSELPKGRDDRREYWMGDLSRDSKAYFEGVKERHDPADDLRDIYLKRGASTTTEIHPAKCLFTPCESLKKLISEGWEITGGGWAENTEERVFLRRYLEMMGDRIEILRKGNAAKTDSLIYEIAEAAFHAGERSFHASRHEALESADINYDARKAQTRNTLPKYGQKLSSVQKEIVDCWEKNPSTDYQKILKGLLELKLAERDDTSKGFRYKGERKFVNKQAIKGRIERLNPKK